MDKEQNFEGVKGFSLGSFAVSWEQRKAKELFVSTADVNVNENLSQVLTNI